MRTRSIRPARTDSRLTTSAHQTIPTTVTAVAAEAGVVLELASHLGGSHMFSTAMFLEDPSLPEGACLEPGKMLGRSSVKRNR